MISSMSGVNPSFRMQRPPREIGMDQLEHIQSKAAEMGMEVNAEEIMNTYDADKDGKIAGDELKVMKEDAPLKDVMEHMRANRPGPMGGPRGLRGGKAMEGQRPDPNEILSRLQELADTTSFNFDAASIMEAYDADEDGLINEEEANLMKDDQAIRSMIQSMNNLSD